MKKILNAKASSHRSWQYILTVFMLLLSMINSSASALAQRADDCPALLRAVKANDVAEVKALLKTTNPNCVYRGDGEPRSPLVAAARNGNLAIGKLLMNVQADVAFHALGDETPLMAAAAKGSLDFVQYLVENGAAINQKLAGEGTALIVAAKSGQTEVVRYLVAQGAEIDAQMDGDGTPLIGAVRNGHYAIAKILLENGANPYLVSPGDEYAMYHATAAKDQSMIDLLEKYAGKNQAEHH